MVAYSMHSPYVKLIQLYNSKRLERCNISYLRSWPSTTVADLWGSAKEQHNRTRMINIGKDQLLDEDQYASL